MGRRVQVIINPGAGQDVPVLQILNRGFRKGDVEWDVSITKESGDAERLAREHAERGVDVVAVYGGDGTVREVAAGLLGTGVPMAIFPGGTGNVMSIELGIPSDLEEAIAIASREEAKVRDIDIGLLNGKPFLLRAGAGFEAEMVAGAPPELKNRFGPLAYAWAAVQALRDRTISRYHLRLDGEAIETAGMTAIIANVGSMGQTGLTLGNTIRPDDGLLDVVIVRGADVSSILAAAAAVVGRDPPQNENYTVHQAREVELEADPPQTVQLDGELVGLTPITARILPRAIRVIVPDEAPLGSPATEAALRPT